MRTYPDILPVPTWPDYGMTPRPQSIHTDMEVGAPRARRFTKSKLWDADIAFRMNDTESGLFWSWFYDDPWALTGDSDRFDGFAVNGLTGITYPTVGPDGQIGARFTENSAASAVHRATISLATLPLNATVAMRATIRAGTRGFARLTFTNWANVFCNVNVDLSTGAFTAGSNYLTRAVKDRSGGWWRIEMTVPAGTGVTTPIFRVEMGSASNTFTYTGDGVSYLDVCEQQARVVSGVDGFLRTDASGNIQGAGAGEAWFNMAVPLGGGMQTRSVQLVTAAGKPLNGGVNWTNSFKALVR
jgi:hypothetical protein